MNKIHGLEELLTYVNSGNTVDFLFFWGHQSKGEAIGDACLSQWYLSPFRVQGILYKTAEHFMMAAKAALFADHDALRKILESPNPADAKAIGRKIRNYDDDHWNRHRYSYVVTGNYAKFTQYAVLKEYILGTGDRVLVEASPTDKIWGIGLAKDDLAVENPNMWKGLNLLGFALMEVRDLVRSA